MKKFLLVLLALVLCLGMVACGDKKDKDDDSSSASSAASGDASTGDSIPNISVPDDSPVGDSAIAGKYMLYSVTSGETVIDQATLGSIGLDQCYVELKADGTFTMVIDDTVEGTYNADEKTMTVEDETISFTLNGDLLSLVDGTDTLTFKK